MCKFFAFLLIFFLATNVIVICGDESFFIDFFFQLLMSLSFVVMNPLVKFILIIIEKHIQVVIIQYFSRILDG